MMNVPTKQTILAIDDDEMILSLIECLLQMHGYRILTAKNSSEGMNLLHTNQVNLVLLDIIMDGESGFDVLLKIRSDEQMKTIPVILLSSLQSKDDRLRGLQMGADDFMSKPFDRDELEVRISNLLKIGSLRNQLAMMDKFTAAMDLLDEAILITSPDFTIQHMNIRALALLDIKDAGDNLKDPLKKKFNIDIDSLVHNGTVPIVLPDNPDLALGITDIKDLGGNISGVVFIFTDNS